MIFDKLFKKDEVKPVCYLDNAATGRYKPRSVLKAVNYELTHSANPGRGGHAESLRASMVLENCREQIRTITGLPNVILTKSCTEALNLAIFGICQSGTVITDCFAHNSILRPLYKLEEDGKINLKILYPSAFALTVDELISALTPDTHAVVLSEMSNVTGASIDLSAIASALNARGIPFIVDAAQSMGHTFQNYSGVTAVASSGHKGLHGIQGSGFLAFSDAVTTLTPLIYGGTGTEAESHAQPLTIPEGYESGTQNTPGYSALAEGIRWTYAFQGAITARLTSLCAYLHSELSSMPNIVLYSPPNSPIIAFNHKSYSSHALAEKLSSNGIYLRSGLHCAPLAHAYLGTLQSGGTLRASPGFSNTPMDIRLLLNALRAL